MKNTIKLILATASVALLAACGGGGGGGSSANDVTYIDYAGKKWSSPSSETYKNPRGLEESINTPTAIKASAYCSGVTTCDTDQFGRQSNCRFSNFNNETNWRLPTKAEVESLYAGSVIPQSWKNVSIWTDEKWNLNLETGQWLYSIGNNQFKNVSCVKP